MVVMAMFNHLLKCEPVAVPWRKCSGNEEEVATFGDAMFMWEHNDDA